jgi:AcrR family transcriptional regulator
VTQDHSGTAGAAVDGLRERHKRRTKIALGDAALSRFLRDGFEATTVEDIAGDVDVSARTFFRYFPTKDAVVLNPYVELFARWVDVIRSSPAGRPLIEALQDASHLVTEAYQQDSEFWDRHRQAVLADPALGQRMLQTQAGLQQEAANALADRLGLDPARDARPRILAAAAMAAAGTAVARWYAGDRRGDRRKLVDAAYEEILTAAALLNEPLPTQQPDPTGSTNTAN